MEHSSPDSISEIMEHQMEILQQFKAQTLCLIIINATLRSIGAKLNNV